HAEIFDEEVAAVARGRAVTTNRHGARRRGRDGGCRASVPSATADALRENAGAGDARRCDRGVRIVDDGDVTAFTALATVATNGDKTGSAATITAAATDAFGIDAIGPVAARDNAAVVGDIDGSAIATGVAAATECDYGARMTAGATAAADAGRGDGVRKVAAGADGAAVGNVNETAIRSSATRGPDRHDATPARRCSTTAAGAFGEDAKRSDSRRGNLALSIHRDMTRSTANTAAAWI